MANAPSVPSYADLLWPTVKALHAIGGSGTNDEIVEKVVPPLRHLCLSAAGLHRLEGHQRGQALPARPPVTTPGGSSILT
jgi:hypothetical protein